MGFFSSSKPKTKMAPEYADQAVGRKYISDLAAQGVPDLPRMNIAGMSPTELYGQDLLGEYARNGSMPETFTAGRDELLKTSRGGYSDLSQNPYFQATTNQVQRSIDDNMNAMRRRLQLQGMGSSAPGVGQLGDVISRGAESMTSALAPYAENERQRAYGATGQLLGYADYEQNQPLKRLEAINQYGGLPRELEQLAYNSQYGADYQEAMFPYTTLSPLYQFMATNKPDYYVQPSSPSGLSNVLGYANSFADLFKGWGTTEQDTKKQDKSD